MLSNVALAQETVSIDWGELVADRSPALVVSGAAGTGKTSLIVARFLHFVAHGVAPDRIVVLTPTAARARALRARLEQELTRGYEQLRVLTPSELARYVLRGESSAEFDPAHPTLAAADRLAMLVERIDELSLQHHDFGGRPTRLLGSFVRKIDRLKAELIGADQYAAWAATLLTAGVESANAGVESANAGVESANAGVESANARVESANAGAEREFADVYRAHERMLADAGARDEGDLIRAALRLAGERPTARGRLEQLLIDDAHELDLGPASLTRALAIPGLTVAGDPDGALRRFRGAGRERMRSFEAAGATRVVSLAVARRSSVMVARAASALIDTPSPPQGAPEGAVSFWRCAGDRAQAQSVAADVERLIGRDGVAPGRIAVLVPDTFREGQAVAVALEERAVPHRLIGDAAFFQRAEIRDVLAWLRLLADPSDAPAVVRALARPPIELRSVDIARCTQIARRRKLDMVGALVAATESPQVPPEARERIRVFLKLYRSAAAAIDTTRPDLYVHRLIERLGLRRQQLFAAQADVVERLRALARFGELASSYVLRDPQATPREFARSIAAVADFGLREQDEPNLLDPDAVQVLGLAAAGGLEVDHVYVLGLDAAAHAAEPEPIPDALLHEPLPADDEALSQQLLRTQLYVAITRARERVVLCYPGEPDRRTSPATAAAETVRAALSGLWEDRQEQLFGPAEALHSTYRLLRDELLEGTMRAGGRLSELRFDTDLDVSHAVVRYLELLKLAALIARLDGDGLGENESKGVGEALRDVNLRILQAVSAEQREIYSSSPLDDYLLDTERDASRRAKALASRDEPSLRPFLPLRGDGVVLSATDIDTYRACPLKYKFARVFRIPQEPTIHQRFGILVHQVLERFHSDDSSSGTLAELLGLLDLGWRRGGFGDSEEERQLRGKAAAALGRYHERFGSEESEPVWFERPFQFKLGPHLLRGRVDRVDRLPNGEYELIDYKTGRPKTSAQLAEDVQLSLYAVAARQAWELDASRGAYYYLLDDQRVRIPEDADRGEWIGAVVNEVADGILSQGFEPTPSFAACSICDYRLVCPAAER
jgi:DNA helicase-2/ATP-dependent DNA helicase PcrA